MYGINMAKGLLVTLKNLTKKPFTVQYPEERVKQNPRFRGEEFVWYEERCTGCASCAASTSRGCAFFRCGRLPCTSSCGETTLIGI